MPTTPEPTDKLDAATTAVGVANGPEGATLDWRQVDWLRPHADQPARQHAQRACPPARHGASARRATNLPRQLCTAAERAVAASPRDANRRARASGRRTLSWAAVLYAPSSRRNASFSRGARICAGLADRASCPSHTSRLTPSRTSVTHSASSWCRYAAGRTAPARPLRSAGGGPSATCRASRVSAARRRAAFRAATKRPGRNLGTSGSWACWRAGCRRSRSPARLGSPSRPPTATSKTPTARSASRVGPRRRCSRCSTG
jgi:hypothetical protein